MTSSCSARDSGAAGGEADAVAGMRRAMAKRVAKDLCRNGRAPLKFRHLMMGWGFSSRVGRSRDQLARRDCEPGRCSAHLCFVNPRVTQEFSELAPYSGTVKHCVPKTTELSGKQLCVEREVSSQIFIT